MTDAARPPGSAPAGEIFGLTDLEDRLWGPDRAAVRAETLERLRSRLERVQKAIDAGLTRKDFEAAQRIGISLAAAREIMVRL